MISNPHPSLQAEKRDKRKQIPKSQGDYLNSARISFGLLFFFLSFLFLQHVSTALNHDAGAECGHSEIK